MIKNATVYRIQLPRPLGIITFEHAIETQKFTPCGATQERASGWAPPRNEAHGAMIEAIAGHLILRFVRETKTVPGQAITRELDALIAKIEREEGRKPGRKEKRELREIVVQSLLPHAFAKRTDTPVWIDPARGLLVIGSTSTAVTDLVITALVRAIDGVKIDHLNTVVAPQAAMTQWLAGGADTWPESFALGRDVELHSEDEMKSVVKFNRHHLDDDQMRLHISQGKLPTALALDFADRMSFTLTKAGQVKKVKLLDVVMEGHEGGFDADWTIACSELQSMLDHLIHALGGEMGQEGGAA